MNWVVWEDVEGQDNVPVNAGFEQLLVQEQNNLATTHGVWSLVI